MTLKHAITSLFILLLFSVASGAMAQTSQPRYVRIAELEIAPEMLPEFKAAIREGIAAAIEKEPEVLALYAVYEKERPNQVRVFEIYVSEDSYRRHLQTEHFQKFRNVTEKMVTSRRLMDGVPIILGVR